MQQTEDRTFVGLNVAATRLGVPIAWLKAEAAAGRVPVLRAGAKFLFNVEAVRAALIERANTAGRDIQDAGGRAAVADAR
jgi:hypothetical protein